MGCDGCGNQFNSPKEFLNFVYKLPTLIENEISVMKPSRQRLWLSMVSKGTLPANVGTNYQKLAVHTPRFRQFNNSEIYHSKQDRAHGPTAAGGANAHCTVGPFHKLNGLGYERMTLAHRRAFFETCEFCVETLWRENVAPEEFFAEYMQGIRDQLDDIMEITHRNEYEERSQKVWAIYNSSGRLLQNAQNAYDWAPLTNAGVLSLPSIEMLYNFAEDVLAGYSDYYSIGTVDGEPVYPLVMNSRTKHNLVFKNKELIEMIKFSSMADNLIEMWQGPISKIGPFVIFVDNDSVRLKRDLVTGQTLQIPHWIPIPAPDGGEMWVEHPEWTQRGEQYADTIMIPRKDAWRKLIRRIPKTLAGVDFGEDLSPELDLKYVNIKDKQCNPFGWIGHFVATHEYYAEPGQNIGLAPCYMLGVHSGIPGTDMLYEEQPSCPEVITPCNIVDHTACPCTAISCIVPHPINGEQAFFTFSQVFSPALNAGNTVSMKTRTGSVQTFTVVTPLQVSADGLTYLLQLPAGATANGPLDPEDYVEVACEVITYCESTVVGISDCRSEVSNAVRAKLAKNLVCSNINDVITLTFKGGYKANFVVLSANIGLQEYVIRYASGFGPTDDPLGLTPATSTWDLCCDRGMPVHACCVPTQANGCAGCEVTFEKCDGTTTTVDSPGGCGCSE
jgi:hypothetical protein